jgi:hypothetical protein
MGFETQRSQPPFEKCTSVPPKDAIQGNTSTADNGEPANCTTAATMQKKKKILPKMIAGLTRKRGCQYYFVA